MTTAMAGTTGTTGTTEANGATEATGATGTKRPVGRPRQVDRAARVRALAPLFAWMEEHGVSARHVISCVYEARGKDVSRCYSSFLKRGLVPAPVWLVEDCCKLLSIPVSVVYPDGPPEIPTRNYSKRRGSGRRFRRMQEYRSFLTGSAPAPAAPAPSSPAPLAPSSAASEPSEWTVA